MAANSSHSALSVEPPTSTTPEGAADDAGLVEDPDRLERAAVEPPGAGDRVGAERTDQFDPVAGLLVGLAQDAVLDGFVEVDAAAGQRPARHPAAALAVVPGEQDPSVPDDHRVPGDAGVVLGEVQVVLGVHCLIVTGRHSAVHLPAAQEPYWVIRIWLPKGSRTAMSVP